MFGKNPKPENTLSGSTSGDSVENTRILSLIAQNYLKEKKSKRRWGLFFKFLIIGYIAVTTFLYFSSSNTEVHTRHTAVVDIDGIISPADISSESIIQSLRNAFQANSSQAVILRINSPGGTPVQAAMINEEIIRLKGLHPDKPVYAAIADICASGGYYIAVAADEIFAHPSSIVGSIGVLMNGFGFTKAMENLGIERRLITAGENKGMLDPFSPGNYQQIQHAEEMLNQVHEQFINAVKSGRGDRISDDPEIYSGLFWSGEQARSLGLVDEFGSADFIAREIVGTETVINYTEEQSFLEAFSSQLGAAATSTVIRYFTAMQ